MANNHKLKNIGSKYNLKVIGSNHKLKTIGSKHNLRTLMLIGLFSAITAVLAQLVVVVPFSPIPVTLQVFAVSLAGILLGSRAGACSQAVYILLGICGLPVFAGMESGIGVLIGPKGGYLVGFPLMAFITGLLVEHFEASGKLTKLTTLASASAGLVLCYASGTVWMGYVLNLDPIKAIMMGTGLFLPFDAVKLLIASVAGFETRKALKKAGLTC